MLEVWCSPKYQFIMCRCTKTCSHENRWCDSIIQYFYHVYINLNRVCENIQHVEESVFDRRKCSVYIWYTSVWSPSYLQADAAFIIHMSCTSKVLEKFENDRIIVKTGLAWCPKPDPHVSAALYAINMHSNICARAYQGFRSVAPKDKNRILGCNWL